MAIPAALGFDGQLARTRGHRHRQGQGQGHRHADVEINVVANSTVRYLLAGTVHEVPAGRLFVYWAGHPHMLLADADGQELEIYWLTVPLAWLQEWHCEPSFISALLTGELLALDPRADDPTRMAEWIDLLAGDAAEREIVRCEVQARLLRVQRAFLQGAANQLAPAQQVPASVTTMLQFLSKQYREDIDVGDVAAASRVHPNHAMHIFKKWCGQSILVYLTDLRLAHVQRLLITTDRSITDIAYDAGFASLSPFYSCFKRRWGMSPRRYRQQFGAEG